MITIDAREVGGIVDLVVSGEVDLDSAEVLQDALQRVLSDGPPAIRVDLAGVSFLNSTGLRALVAGATDAKHRGIRYSVVHPQRAVRRVLDIAGLTETLCVD